MPGQRVPNRRARARSGAERPPPGTVHSVSALHAPRLQQGVGGEEPGRRRALHQRHRQIRADQVPGDDEGRVGSADRGTVAVPPTVNSGQSAGHSCRAATTRARRGLRIHPVQRVDEPPLLDLPDRRRRHGVGVEFDDTAAGARRPAGRLALPRAPAATPTRRSPPGRSGRARPPRSTRCDAAAAAAPAADRPGQGRTPHGATPAPGVGAPRRGRPPPPRRPRCPRRARPPPSRRSARRSDPVRRSTPPAAARGRTAR